MDTREAYKEKYAAQLQEWKAKVDVLEAQASKAKAQAKIDLAPHVDGVHAKYEAAKAKLEQIAQATDDRWQDLKSDADKAWHDLEHSVEGALAAIKPHTTARDLTKN